MALVARIQELLGGESVTGPMRTDLNRVRLVRRGVPTRAVDHFLSTSRLMFNAIEDHVMARCTDLMPDDFRLLGIEIPDAAPIERLGQTPADANACLLVGDDFLRRGTALILQVPRIVVPQEHNSIINVRNPAMADVQVVRNDPFRIDPRLLGPAAR